MSVFNGCNWWTNQDSVNMADRDDDEVCLLDAPLEEATTQKALAAGLNENRIASEHVVALHQLLEPECVAGERAAAAGAELLAVVVDDDEATAKETCDKSSEVEPKKDGSEDSEDSDKPASSLVWVTDEFELPSTEELFSDLGIWW